MHVARVLLAAGFGSTWQHKLQLLNAGVRFAATLDQVNFSLRGSAHVLESIQKYAYLRSLLLNHVQVCLQQKCQGL